MENATISEYLDNDYKEYAKYVIESRAIPSVIDGLKPTQRKVIHASNKHWKSETVKPMKVYQLGGKIAAEVNYHHGDSSMNSAITGMAQKFKNSMPLLEEIGQFGSLRAPDAGAPRYISTKLHKNFRLLYKDFELLNPRYEEGTEIEPDYFLPIIPTVLLNGSSGIAVGFATNILNRNPLDLINCCLKELAGRSFNEPIPWINEFKGECIKQEDTNGSWTFYGSYKIKNTTTVDISELPPSITYLKYDDYLNNLEDLRKISSYDNNCKSDVNYVVKFTRAGLAELEKKGRLSKFLKMEERQTENFTVLDETGKLKVFNTSIEIIKYFVKFRLKFYTKRKRYLINKISNELTLLSNKAKFIKMIIENKLKINNIPKNEIIKSLTDNSFDKIDGSYTYLLSMPIHSLTKEKYEELLKMVGTKIEELKLLKGTKPEDMYKMDLENLKKAIKKQY